MRHVKMILLLLALPLTSTALAGHISPGLEAYLAEKHDGGHVKALVVLRDQVDIQTMDWQLHQSKATRAQRNYQVVTALQQKASATQGPLLAELDARVGKDIAGYRAYWLINAVLVTATEEAIRDIAARDDVDIVELDLKVALIEPVEVGPIDDKALAGIGITPGVVSVGARRVWDELGIRGEGAIVGILDTGVAGNHPALAARWRGNVAPWHECWIDVLGSGGSQFPSDGNGHGTHVAGTAVGLAPDDTIGVAPEALWIASNAINQGGGSELDNDIIVSLEFFTDPDGDPATVDDVPDVVQNSWGVNSSFSGYYECDSRWWDAIDACEAAGVVLVWSAGNEGPNSRTMRSPADRATTLFNCFSVGSTVHSPPFTISGFSSRGPAGPSCGPSENLMKPEVVAPGSNIYSAYPPSGYTTMSGTSMAGPHVAGVVALMRSANPNVDVMTIKQVLMDTAIDLGVEGEDNTYGHGFVDAYAAVLAVMGGLGHVEGYVLDSDTGLPVEGAVITVEGAFQTAVTPADGFFSLMMPVGPATLNVAVFAYEPGSATVEIIEDETVTVDINLQALPSATVHGIVYEPGQAPYGGTPAAGATVSVLDTPLAAITTNAEGAFSFVLPLGQDYVFEASDGSSGTVSQLVPVYDDLLIELYPGPLSQDGFETDDFSALPWTFAGSADWLVQSAVVYEGDYAARSGQIGSSSSTSLDVTIDCGDGGEVSFWFRVSSSIFHYLEFYLNGTRLDRWSGEVGWTRYTTTVPAGVHDFRWRYVKNWWFAGGQDRAWIDSVSFPGSSDPKPLAVATPWDYETTLDQGEVISLPLLLMNQGQLPLSFTASATDAWVELDTDVGTVEPSEYQLLQVTLSAVDLPAGLHTTAITIASDDPVNPQLQVEVQLEVVGGATSVADFPSAVAVLGAVPNPFNPSTTIRYSLPAGAHADLRLYDLQGRLVRTLVNELRPSGLNEAHWDGRDDRGRAVASGTYFARLQAAGASSTKSLTLVR